jgi:hypothetical protein
VLTLTVSAPIKHTPVCSNLLTPQSLGQRLQFRRCACASERILDASAEEISMCLGVYWSKRKGGAR